MGFLSGIFGSGSEWDGSAYVAKVVGNKFWHRSFIDKDGVRKSGQEFAFMLDPLGARIGEQSPTTLVGELVCLLQICSATDDVSGAKCVAKAIRHLLESDKSKLPPFADMHLESSGYKDFL